MDFAQFANRKSPRLQDGTAITFIGGQKVDQTQQTTECSYIPTVINKFTAKDYLLRNRVLQRAFERLELLDAKVSRAVLRGRDGGNTTLLPDTLATLSDRMIFENPRVLKQAQKKLRRLERTKSRRKKGSKNRAKARKAIVRLHARIANIRKDVSHKLTTYLCKNHALVAIEDLHVAGMLKNHKLAQAISDSNFGEIRRQLDYKSQRFGAYLAVIDRFYPSSKTCSACGSVRDTLSLGERVFVCEDCGYVTDRDYNAAKNLVTVAVSSIDTQNACGESSAGYFDGRSETTLAEAGTNHLYGLSI
jgi:IS605 OrfB family transposase